MMSMHFEIGGHETFAGENVHSARWRHDLDLEGRRAGVIGTGAGAAQLVPEIAEVASHVSLCQRTPNRIVPRKDRRCSEEELTINNRVASVEAYKARTARLDPEDFEVTA